MEIFDIWGVIFQIDFKNYTTERGRAIKSKGNRL